MKGISVCEISTETGSSFSEELSTDDSISELILSNSLLYNLYFFAQESVYLGKSFLLKIVCVK